MVNITLKVDASAPIGIIEVFTNGIYIGTLKPGELAVNEICNRLLTPTARALVVWAREAYTELACDARHDTSLTDLMERGKAILAAVEAKGDG